MTIAKPADDKLIASLADAVAEVRAHDHRPQYGPDDYCLNLTSWMGERMGAVLARVDEQAERIRRLENVASAAREWAKHRGAGALTSYRVACDALVYEVHELGSEGATERTAEIQRLRAVAEAVAQWAQRWNQPGVRPAQDGDVALLKAMRALPAVAGQPHYHDPIECGCELTAADAPKAQPTLTSQNIGDRLSPGREVEGFNAAYPVGTPVRYWKGVREGDGLTSRTRSEAQVLGGHTAVVWVENEASCIALSHIQATR